MDNKFTEVATLTYGQNIKNSFSLVIFGIILFIASFFLLWWNEGNSVRLIEKEDFINKNAIAVNSTAINRSNDMKLIATNGSVYTDETLSDFMVTIDKALNLKRTVEMYQWIEKKHERKQKNMGGSTTKTTTYTYEKKWDDSVHNSNRFKQAGYTNPKFTFKSKALTVNRAKMGDFKLNSDQISQIGGYRRINRLEDRVDYKIIDNYYYKGNDYSNPEVGDIRISYNYVPSGASISIIGQQNWDNSIGEMSTKNGPLYLQYDGILSLDEMLNKFKKSNMITTFVLRLGGFLMMYAALRMLTSPLLAIAGFIPILSEIAEFISSFMLGILAVTLTLLTIAIAWFAYRPVITILLIVSIGLIIYEAKRYIQNKKSVKIVSNNPM